jgi:hypothetical protein
LTPRQKFDGSFANVVKLANGSAVRLVQLLLEHFPSVRDEPVVDGRKIRIWKRAQICVGEIWAALDGRGLAAFDDIDQLTMWVPLLRTLCAKKQQVRRLSSPSDPALGWDSALLGPPAPAARGESAFALRFARRGYAPRSLFCLGSLRQCPSGV